MFFTCCQCINFSSFVCHLLQEHFKRMYPRKESPTFKCRSCWVPFFPLLLFCLFSLFFCSFSLLTDFLDTIERWLFVIAALTRPDATYGASAAIMRALQLCRHASTHITSKLLACRFVVCLLLFLLTIHQEHTRERHE